MKTPLTMAEVQTFVVAWSGGAEGLFVQQIDICLCLFVRHPPNSWRSLSLIRALSLMVAIAAGKREAAHEAGSWAYILAVEMGDVIKRGGDRCG